MLILTLLLQSLFSFEVSLDTHIHWDTKLLINANQPNMRSVNEMDIVEYLQDITINNPAKKFFFLSEGYHTDSAFEMWEANNEIISISQEKSAAIPVCGLNLKYVDRFEYLSNCTSNEKIKGYKVHMEADRESLQNLDTYNNIESFLNTIKDKQNFLLIHMGFELNKDSYNQNEAKALLELAKQNPNIRFILAHLATYYPKIFSMAKEEGVTNIYTETSVALTSFNKNKISHYGYTEKELYSHLHKNGIDKILYGSDTFITHPLNNKTILSIKNSSYLSKKEKQKILVDNGNHFLQSLGISN